MRFNVIQLGLTTCIIWAAVVFLVGIGNLVFAGYGEAFLRFVESIYPGYTYGKWAFGGVIVAMLYAALDGFVMGVVFAWLFNLLGKSMKKEG
ncbi:MAG: hypothetical protein GTO16_05455 [Candidatus Aminicenantes bacterium]|nr:hypothetical protein [Candidatus Aminicenantes bacterium]